MGLGKDLFDFLAAAASRGIPRERVLTLGRLHNYTSPRDVGKILERHKFPAPDERPGTTQFAEHLFRAIGAGRVDSLDISDYEGATVLHDLNEPPPPELRGAFDLVVDGGTLEHVHNVSQAFDNLIALVRPGGHIAMITPANNQCGHGFYQFSPEMIYRTFSAERGCRMLWCVLLVRGPFRSTWHLVRDPATIGARIEVITHWPTFLLVLARREKETAPAAADTQQSDYAQNWIGNPAAQAKTTRQPEGRFSAARRWLQGHAGAAYPVFLNLYRHFFVTHPGNKKFFTPVDGCSLPPWAD